MKIQVHYAAQAREAAGTPTEQIEWAEGCASSDLLVRLAERHPPLRPLLLNGAGEPSRSVLVFIDDEQVRVAEPRALKDGDVVTIVSPISGG